MQRRFPAPTSIFWRILLVVAVGLVLMLAGFSLLGLQTIRESTERTLQERLVIAQVTADRVDDLLQRNADILQMMVDKAALNPGDPNLVSNGQALRTMREHLGDFVHYVALVDRRGIVVWSEPYLEDVIGSDLSSGRCVQKVLGGAGPMITKVFTLGKTTPSAALLAGTKGPDGSVWGLVYAAVNLGHPGIAGILKPLGLGQTGYAEIVDENGVILASTSPERLWQKGDHGDRFTTLIQEKRTTVGTCHDCHSATNGLERREDVMAFAPLTVAPWGVAVRQSQDEALAYSQTMERRVLVFGAGAFLVALVCTWLAARYLVRPLQILTTACQRIAAGDLAQPISPMGSGEISTLARSFDTMRERLKGSLNEIQEWNLELERRVDQRTKELEEAERGRRELLRKLVVAQEEERRRLARELHDETSQALTALTVGLETAIKTPAESAEEVKERLGSIKSLAGEMLRELQRIILDLRPAILDDLGLVQAIDWYAESRLKSRGIQVELETVGVEKRLPSEVETVVFRISQEAITNVAKHAGAENVSIGLDFTDSVVVLYVEDDGRGFDPEATLARGKSNASFGLLGMRERATLFGGTVKIQSRPSQGTRITVEIPLKGTQWNGEDSGHTGG